MEKESNPSKILGKLFLTSSTKVITTFLELILTLNNFIFNCKKYLQIKGCAICAPRIGKHLYGSLRNKFHIFIHQDTFTFILQVHRRYIFQIDRQQNRYRKFCK